MSNENSFSKNIFLSGLNINFRNSVCVNHDSVQNICVVGFNDGTVKVFGKYGYEVSFKININSLIKNIYFIENEPFVIIVTEQSIEKWNYVKRQINNVLLYKNSRITASSFEFGLHHLFFSTEDSVIHVVNVYDNFLSSHTIEYPSDQFDRKSFFGSSKAIPKNQPISPTPSISTTQNESSNTGGNNNDNNDNNNNNNNKPIPIPVHPTCIKVSPVNANFLLVGYSNGLVVVWSLQDKVIERRFVSDKVNYCTSVSWTRKGTKIICSFIDGEIHIINYLTFERKVLYKSPVSNNNNNNNNISNSSSISNNNNNYSLIHGLKLIYSNSKKLLLFKGHFSSFEDNKSLIVVKFNKFKENYSVNHVASDIGPFCTISTSPYFNDNYNTSAFQSILAVKSSNEEMVEFKLDPSTFFFFPTLLKEFNSKSMNRFPKMTMMKNFECSSLVIELIYDSLKLSTRNFPTISGGSIDLISGCGNIRQRSIGGDTCQLLITAHVDQTLQFWNSSDAKNLIYLGVLDLSSVTNEIVSFSFCLSTSLLSISIKDKSNSNNGTLLFYTISAEPKRIDKRTFKPIRESEFNEIKSKLNVSNGIQNLNINESNQSSEEQILTKDPSTKDSSNEDPSTKDSSTEDPSTEEQLSAPTSTEEQSSSSSSTLNNKQENQLKKSIEIKQLPLPMAESSVFKLMGDIKLQNEIITSVTTLLINSTISNRLIIGTSNGKVYHFIITQLNEKNPNYANSPILYSINATFYGVLESDSSSMVSTISILVPENSNRDNIDSIAFVGKSNGKVSLVDLEKMKSITLSESIQLNDSIESIYFINNDNDQPILESFNLLKSNINTSGSELITKEDKSSSSSKTTSIYSNFKVIVSSTKDISLFRVSFNNNNNNNNNILLEGSYEKLNSIQASFISGATLSSFIVKKENGSQVSVVEKPVIISLNIDNISNPVLNIYETNLTLLESNQIDPIIKLSSNISTILSITKRFSNAYIYQFNNNNNNDGDGNDNGDSLNSSLYSICIDKEQLNQYLSLYYNNLVMPPKPAVAFSFFAAHFDHSVEVLEKFFKEKGTQIPSLAIDIEKANHQTLVQAIDNLLRTSENIDDLLKKTAILASNAKAFNNKN